MQLFHYSNRIDKLGSNLGSSKLLHFTKNNALQPEA